MRTLIALAACAAVVVMPTLGLAADARDITVVNKTGKPVASIFISPVDTSEWEEDILGVDVLEDGQSVDIAFSGYDEDACNFDVLASNDDGDQWLLTDVDLCTVAEITLTAKYIKAE